MTTVRVLNRRNSAQKLHAGHHLVKKGRRSRKKWGGQDPGGTEEADCRCICSKDREGGIFYYNFPHNMCARCRTKRKPNRDVWERLCSSSGRRFNCGQDMHKCSWKFSDFLPSVFLFCQFGVMFMWRTSSFKYTFGSRNTGTGWKSSVLTTIYTTAIIFLSPAPLGFSRRRFTFPDFVFGALSLTGIAIEMFSMGCQLFSFPLCRRRKWFMRVRRVCLHQEATFPLAT